MLATKLVLRQPLRQVLLHRSVPALRYLSTTPTPAPRRTAIPEDSPLLQPSTLSVWFEKHPKIGQAVFNFLGRMGAFSPKNSVRHRSLHLYSRLIATVPDLEKDFWFNECDLPPTFQSWFTVANLHIWMLTVRLRALPKKYGRVYVQAVTDQFFFDIEDRIRNILQPQWKPRPPYTFTTDFYQNPNAPKPGQTPDNTQLSRAPDRIVTRHLKIFREQWNGLMVAMDMSLIRGDTEMASAIWRNILGARGAKGIAFPGDPAKFRRSINYAGSDINKLEKMNVEEEELKDDGSGVHDFPPDEADKYLAYPELMLDLVQYVRRELARLDKLTDEQIVYGDWEELMFRPIREAAPPSSVSPPPQKSTVSTKKASKRQTTT